MVSQNSTIQNIDVSLSCLLGCIHIYLILKHMDTPRPEGRFAKMNSAIQESKAGMGRIHEFAVAIAHEAMLSELLSGALSKYTDSATLVEKLEQLEKREPSKERDTDVSLLLRNTYWEATFKLYFASLKQLTPEQKTEASQAMDTINPGYVDRIPSDKKVEDDTITLMNKYIKLATETANGTRDTQK